MTWPYGVVSLVARGQRVYVVHESSDQSKPILIRDHWPTIHSVHELPTEWETRYKSLESQGGGSGGYAFWYEGNGFGNYMSIFLMFRGQTESIKRDVLEILPPKTKQETRYQDGRWQRYLKSDKRGWIDCQPWHVAQPLERVGPAIHPIGERITFEKTDVCLVYRDSLAKDPNDIARLMYDNLHLQIAKGFSDQLVEYIKKDAAQYCKGDVIEIPERNTQVILGNAMSDSFETYSQKIHDELVAKGVTPVKAIYDEGMNCLICGESGRCPGWHTPDELRAVQVYPLNAGTQGTLF